MKTKNKITRPTLPYTDWYHWTPLVNHKPITQEQFEVLKAKLKSVFRFNLNLAVETVTFTDDNLNLYLSQDAPHDEISYYINGYLDGLEAAAPAENNLDTFDLGDRVDVTPFEHDTFDDFNGRIIAKRGEFLVVEDMDGDAWDCLPAQLTKIN